MILMHSCFLFSAEEAKLPPPTIFGKSLYTFYIGQNDFTGNLANIGISGVKQFLPQVVSQISSTIKVTSDQDHRSFPFFSYKKGYTKLCLLSEIFRRSMH